MSCQLLLLQYEILPSDCSIHVFCMCFIASVYLKIGARPQALSVCVLSSLVVLQVCNLSPPGDAQCPLPSLLVCLPSHYRTGHCQPLDADV